MTYIITTAILSVTITDYTEAYSLMREWAAAGMCPVLTTVAG